MNTPYFNNMCLCPLIDWEGQVAHFAKDAYAYGFPLLLMDKTRRKGLLSLAQNNKFYHQKELIYLAVYGGDETKCRYALFFCILWKIVFLVRFIIEFIKNGLIFSPN